MQQVFPEETPHVFIANTDGSSIVRNDLTLPVKTKRVRIRPNTWNRGIVLAIELYGYVLGMLVQTTELDREKPDSLYRHV